MKVVKKPKKGTNFVQYELDGNLLSFGDDEIIINLKKKERDDDVTIDVCRDLLGGLVTSTGGAQTYVAQVFIPARSYTETVEDNPDYDPNAEYGEAAQKTITKRDPVDFDADKVTLYLYEEA